MRKLYEINADIEACVDYETGEIFDIEKLASLEIEKNEKIKGVALLRKDVKAELDALTAEIKSLQARKKSCETTIKGIDGYLLNAVEGKAFTSDDKLVKITIRTNQKVHEGDICALPEQYQRTKTTIEADKIALTEALKNGESFDGWYLEETKSVSVK